MARLQLRVSVGDVFQKTDRTSWKWVVKEIFTPAFHRPHARLYRRDYPVDVRLISIAALNDRRVFVRVGVSDGLVERRLADPIADTDHRRPKVVDKAS